MKMSQEQQTVTAIFLVFAAIIIIWQATARVVVDQEKHGQTYTPPAPESNQPCKGEPIKVNYSFRGSYIEPHACLPQCQDQIQRYILYANGKATQCEPLPGCNDWGEDNGIECEPPSENATESN